MIAWFAGVLWLGMLNSPVSAGETAARACLADGSGFLEARLRGSLEADLAWRGPGLECSGMPRPDGRGMRLRFAGPLPGAGGLTLVFAPPVLAEGESARAVPVNVTILDEAGGRIFGTLGDERCVLDDVTQSRVPGEDEDGRTWAIEARGFCTGPARALDQSGAVLLTRFDFRGRVTLTAPETGPAEPEDDR